MGTKPQPKHYRWSETYKKQTRQQVKPLDSRLSYTSIRKATWNSQDQHQRKEKLTQQHALCILVKPRKERMKNRITHNNGAIETAKKKTVPPVHTHPPTTHPPVQFKFPIDGVGQLEPLPLDSPYRPRRSRLLPLKVVVYVPLRVLNLVLQIDAPKCTVWKRTQHKKQHRHLLYRTTNKRVASYEYST